MKTIEEKITTTRTLHVLPCIKCGNEDIEIYNCNYSSFNCAGGKCRKCGHQVETGASWNVKDAELVRAWNRANSPDKLLKELEKRKAELTVEISNMRKKVAEYARKNIKD